MSDPIRNEFCLVLSNFPDHASAHKLAEHLVTQQLAACVNILPAGTSIYQWQNQLHQDNEVAVIIKTRHTLLPQIEHAILAQHPYELPEIISVPIEHGYQPYLNWLSEQTRHSLT